MRTITAGALCGVLAVVLLAKPPGTSTDIDVSLESLGTAGLFGIPIGATCGVALSSLLILCRLHQNAIVATAVAAGCVPAVGVLLTGITPILPLTALMVAGCAGGYWAAFGMTPHRSCRGAEYENG